MKKLITSLILYLFLLLSFNARSQSLGVDTNAFNLASLPDTINLNDNYTHHIVVQNKSATVLNGTIYLVAAVDTLDSLGTLLSIDTVGSIAVSNFGLNDTVGITYAENYNLANGYKVGGNIVVVWPVANFGTTADSIKKFVYINNSFSIDDYEKDNPIIIYPNPVGNELFIRFMEPKITVKQVRIYDVNGRIIYKDQFKSKLNVSDFPKGIYILHLEMKDEKELHYKLIKD